MILAIDVHYKEDYAKTIGVVFEWTDDVPKEVISVLVDEVEEYVPGEFYKRELPCILKLLGQVDLTTLECIIVDGHVYTSNDKGFGLGAHLYEALGCEVPIVGVAKRSFFNTDKVCQPLLRGDSKMPLFVSAVGYDENLAFQKIKNMKGEYRIPTILKTLDGLTKED